MIFDLSEKVAVISGASRGIGKAIAVAMVEAGASVVIGSRKAENIFAAADVINSMHPDRAIGCVAHAGDSSSAEQMVATAVEHFGRLDIAVNNAATNPHFGPLLSSEESQWDKIFDVNVKGAFWLSRAAALRMKEQGQGGKIINIASIAGIEPGPKMGIYSVSKAAVIMLTKVLAVELAADNIQVNAVAPGFVKTYFSKALWQDPAVKKMIVDGTVAGRLAEPDEIAGAVLYLASEMAGFTTGTVITVDGGYTLT